MGSLMDQNRSFFAMDSCFSSSRADRPPAVARWCMRPGLNGDRQYPVQPVLAPPAGRAMRRAVWSNWQTKDSKRTALAPNLAGRTGQ